MLMFLFTPSTAQVSRELGEAFGVLVELAQIATMWISILMSLWGVNQVSIGQYKGLQKIKWAFIAYIGSLVLPKIYFILDEVLRGLKF